MFKTYESISFLSKESSLVFCKKMSLLKYIVNKEWKKQYIAPYFIVERNEFKKSHGDLGIFLIGNIFIYKKNENEKNFINF